MNYTIVKSYKTDAIITKQGCVLLLLSSKYHIYLNIYNGSFSVSGSKTELDKFIIFTDNFYFSYEHKVISTDS